VPPQCPFEKQQAVTAEEYNINKENWLSGVFNNIKKHVVE